MDSFDFQKAQRARILSCYSNADEITKAEDNDIEKGGRAATVGERRVYNGKSYQKMPGGHWQETVQGKHKDFYDKEIHGYEKDFIPRLEENARNSNNSRAKRYLDREKETLQSYKQASAKLSDKKYSDEEVGLNKDKILGHTKSGKSVYDHFDHPAHKDFTPEEHRDAFNLHKQEREKHGIHDYDAGWDELHHQTASIVEKPKDKNEKLTMLTGNYKKLDAMQKELKNSGLKEGKHYELHTAIGDDYPHAVTSHSKEAHAIVNKYRGSGSGSKF